MGSHSSLSPRQLKDLDMLWCKPSSVSSNDGLNKALTIMQMNNYSQLPVTGEDRQEVIGAITWKSIGIARANGCQSELVNDYVETDIARLSLDSPLTEALNIVMEYEFAVVFDSSEEMCGIVTTTDLLEKYIQWTKPFVMLDRIEKLLRLLLTQRLPLEVIKETRQGKRPVNSVDDLMFHEYIRIIKDESNWKILHLEGVDKDYFVDTLDRVRELRNSVMHFHPKGISNVETTLLPNMSTYLARLIEQEV